MWQILSAFILKKYSFRKVRQPYNINLAKLEIIILLKGIFKTKYTKYAIIFEFKYKIKLKVVVDLHIIK